MAKGRVVTKAEKAGKKIERRTEDSERKVVRLYGYLNESDNKKLEKILADPESYDLTIEAKTILRLGVAGKTARLIEELIRVFLINPDIIANQATSRKK